MLNGILAAAVALILIGCGDPNTRLERTNDRGSRQSQTVAPTEDPTKFTCKKLCRETKGCPVSLAHCKKERDPPVCWSFYYLSASRNGTCFHRANQGKCPEQHPVYCNGETEEILPDFYPKSSNIRKPTFPPLNEIAFNASAALPDTQQLV